MHWSKNATLWKQVSETLRHKSQHALRCLHLSSYPAVHNSSAWGRPTCREAPVQSLEDNRRSAASTKELVIGINKATAGRGGAAGASGAGAVFGVSLRSQQFKPGVIKLSPPAGRGGRPTGGATLFPKGTPFS